MPLLSLYPALLQPPAEPPAPDVTERVSVTANATLEKLQDVAAHLPLVGLGLVVVALFILVARLLGRWQAPFARLRLNPFATDLVRQAIQVLIVLVGILIALDLLDATALVGAALGTAGVMGIALGFAFRDLIENYISSILLSIRQPFAPDDHVVIGSDEGKVIRLTSRATILMTLDGNHLRIPNAQVFKGVILNYSRNPLRRFKFGVGVGVGEDLVAARRLGIETLAEVPGVVDEPAPEALINELGDSSVLFQFFGWVDQREASFNKVRSEAIRQVKTALEAAGMDLPEPTYRLQMVAPAAQPPTGADPARPGQTESGVAIDGGPSTVVLADEPEATPDTAPDDALDRQIAEDRAADPGVDLLRPDGPQE